MNNVDSIVDYIESGASSSKNVGLELEHFVCNDEYQMISYPEMAECLAEICEKVNGQAFILDGSIYGIFCDDYNISIEPACQLEISIYPKETPEEIYDIYNGFRQICEPVFVSRGYQLLEKGVFPLIENGDMTADEMPLIPKERYRFMDEHFKKTGNRGRYMMRATASTQVCIDFSSEEDAMKKLRVLQKLAPILSLIAENKNGIGTGEKWKTHLLRNQIWREVDPVRCGYLEGSVGGGYSFREYAKYLNEHSSIQFREESPEPDENTTMKKVEGDDLSVSDIEHLISVYFPMVRLKKYIEYRAADSMPIERAIGFAMLVKTMMYQTDLLDALDEKLGHVEQVTDIYATEDLIFEQGYRAVVYGKPVMEWMQYMFSAVLNCTKGTERAYVKKIIPLPLLNYEYKELVEGNEYEHKESALGIREYLMNSTAKYHNRVVKTLYLPKLFTRKEMELFRQAVTELYGIFDKVIAEFESNESYRRLFGFSEELTELILREKKYRCNIPISRIDIFYNEEIGDFKFCEFNTDGTSAMNEDRELGIAFSRTKAYQEFARTYELSSFELFDTWVEEVLTMYREYAGSSEPETFGNDGMGAGEKETLPNIAIVDFMENATENEFKIFAERFRRRGCNAEICDIRNIRWNGTECRTETGMKVDVIYRRAVTSDILSHMNEVQEFIEAVKSDTVCMLGDFRTQIAHNKVLYKILHMDETMRLLTRREQVFVKAHVPYTVALDEMFAEGNEKLKEDVFANKDKWIIKPEDSYGSQGVHAGVEHENRDEWVRMLEENKDKKYILQAFNNPYELMNIDFREEDYRWVNASNLTGLFVYNEKLYGAYSRISFVKMISTQYSEMSSPTILVQ